MYGENIPFPRDLRHALSLSKQYTDENRIAHDDAYNVRCPLKFEGEPDSAGLGFDFYWQSALTPSKDDLANGEISLDIKGASVELPPFTIVPVFDNDVLYGGQLNSIIEKQFNIVVVIAYSAGEHTVPTVYGDTHTMSIPRKGIYVASTEDLGTAEAFLQLAWHEVHPIDPKFLPEPIVIDIGAFGNGGENADISPETFETLLTAVKSGNFVLCRHTTDFTMTYKPISFTHSEDEAMSVAMAYYLEAADGVAAVCAVGGFYIAESNTYTGHLQYQKLTIAE